MVQGSIATIRAFSCSCAASASLRFRTASSGAACAWQETTHTPENTLSLSDCWSLRNNKASAPQPRCYVGSSGSAPRRRPSGTLLAPPRLHPSPLRPRSQCLASGAPVRYGIEVEVAQTDLRERWVNVTHVCIEVRLRTGFGGGLTWKSHRNSGSRTRRPLPCCPRPAADPACPAPRRSGDGLRRVGLRSRLPLPSARSGGHAQPSAPEVPAGPSAPRFPVDAASIGSHRSQQSKA